jgi:hypothetical protein
MNIADFCGKLAGLQLSQWQQALAILWFHDEKQPDAVMSAGQLAKIIYESGLGVPHSTQLREAIKKSGLVLTSKKGFRLKALSRTKIRDWLQSILGATKPELEQDLGYLPREVWDGTRTYIERVCIQLNGCYQFEFYDAAAVLVRRLAETLIIEAYEALKRESEIKDSGGNYCMLRDLVSRTVAPTGLNIGRNTKEALKSIKEQGDLSAHNRRFNARKFDLDNVQMGVRVFTEELIVLAALKKKEVP